MTVARASKQHQHQHAVTVLECTDAKVSFTKIRRSQKLGFIGWDGYSGSAILGLAAKCATVIASAM